MKLTMYCGDYGRAVQHSNGAPMIIVTQGAETGWAMVEQGRAALSNVAAMGDTEGTVFNNNDHYLNGVRLALKAGTILPEQLTVLFFPEDSDQVTEITFDAQGTASGWPRGFFDALEHALSQL